MEGVCLAEALQVGDYLTVATDRMTPKAADRERATHASSGWSTSITPRSSTPTPQTCTPTWRTPSSPCAARDFPDRCCCGRATIGCSPRWTPNAWLGTPNTRPGPSPNRCSSAARSRKKSTGTAATSPARSASRPRRPAGRRRAGRPPSPNPPAPCASATTCRCTSGSPATTWGPTRAFTASSGPATSPAAGSPGCSPIPPGRAALSPWSASMDWQACSSCRRKTSWSWSNPTSNESAATREKFGTTDPTSSWPESSSPPPRPGHQGRRPPARRP